MGECADVAERQRPLFKHVRRQVGRPATERLDRDVLSVSGQTSVIWLEGVNDLASNQSDPQPVITGYKVINDRLRKAGIIVIAATLTPSYRAKPGFHDVAA